ncbi:MAG: LemA family protein [Gammaproteobacteria bacterium]|nr:LemA family protein [Gammaproteobacteria bacterium]
MLLHGSIFQKLLFGVLTLGFGIVAWLLTQSGVQEIRSLYQIERYPISKVASSLPGPVKLKVTVDPKQKFVTSEFFQTPSVYYDYRQEEEEVDSDGNTSWNTVYSNSKAINFYAYDESGRVLIKAWSAADSDTQFSLPISQRSTKGDMRYTEWRIEPNDTLFLLGYREPQDDLSKPAEVSFLTEGQFPALLSKYSEDQEKEDIGLAVILKVCGGISLFALAALTLVVTLGIHRILAFLMILSFSAIIPLVNQGYSMIYFDVSGTSDLLIQREAEMRKRILETVGEEFSDGTQWRDIIEYLEDNRLRNSQVDDMLTDTAFLQRQFETQLHQFPNNTIAWLIDTNIPSIYKSLPNELKAVVDVKLSDFHATKTSGGYSFWIMMVCFLVCGGLSFWAFKLIRMKRHIENLPTSKLSALAYGLSEIKGRVKTLSDYQSMKSPLTSSSCCWYRYIVEERRGSGDDAKWVTITDDTAHTEFVVDDHSGQIKVDLLNAEVLSKTKHTERRGSRRYTEKLIEINDKVYLLGPALIDQEKGDKLEIRHEKGTPYIFTNYAEDALMYRKAYGGMLSLCVAFACLMFGSLFYLGMQGSFAPIDYLIAALIAPAYMFSFMLILHYNDLIFLKQRAQRNFSNIEVSMQKRFDLIPNLEKVVKTHMEHEKRLLTHITRLRKNLGANENDPKRIGKLVQYEQKVLNKTIMLLEKYPDLKSNQLVINVMNKLVDLENEISLMREGFNDAVEYYNTRVEVFPDVILAKIFKFQRLDFLQFKEKKFERVSFS